ncbi:MAG: hypothetical protein AB7G93_16145 [Bdellovibrionales bacterium]
MAGEKSSEHSSLSSYDEIHPLVRAWLDSRQRELRKLLPRKVGEEMRVAGSLYRIVALLGVGAESYVYLVNDGRGFKVAKEFKILVKLVPMI